VCCIIRLFPSQKTAGLRRAADDFDKCGAVGYCGETGRELRKLGHRIQQRTRPGGPAGTALEPLTERELQLTMLVVDRKTNPEIAAELFLSQKTVETHLRNIFRKVGVTSRVELARAAEQAQRASGAPSQL
jgi:DNA-binding NarL/FixJ family response regulator